MTRSQRPSFAEDDFRKATASNPDKECVRIARRDGWTELRDDKTPFGSQADTRIILTSTEFDEFQAGIRAGKRNNLPLRLEPASDGTYILHGGQPHTTLTFTAPEITAFLDGIHNHEFNHDTKPPTAA